MVGIRVKYNNSSSFLNKLNSRSYKIAFCSWLNKFKAALMKAIKAIISSNRAAIIIHSNNNSNNSSNNCFNNSKKLNSSNNKTKLILLKAKIKASNKTK